MEDVKSDEEQKRITVADYLLDKEMDEAGDGEGLVTFHCMTPGDIVSRWVRKLRRRVKKRKCDNVCDNGTMQAKCLMKCLNDGDMSLGVVEENKPLIESADSSLEKQMSSFELGAGLGLALVVAASKNELTKMIELRKQMELIVENAKEELRHKTADTCEKQSYLITNNEESINSTGGSNPICSVSQTRSSPYIEMNDKQSLYFDLDVKEFSVEQLNTDGYNFYRLDHLESELEAELKLLDELQLGSEGTSVDNKNSVQQSSDSWSETVDHEEEVNHANDPINAFAEAHNGGVPPQELERRLHELLEAQQEERIKELEAALRSTKLKLRKQEIEERWWRDTAHQLSPHFSNQTTRSVPCKSAS